MLEACEALSMSASTPDDLAVAFRSLARRRREAIGDANPGRYTAFTDELQHHVDAAARAVGSTADASAVAAAISARPPEAWDDATLDELRRIAIDAGAVLRRLTTAVEADAADDR
jgi:hypothetical protein